MSNVRRGPGGRWLPGGPSPNPSGRPALSEAQQAAHAALRGGSLAAARRLLELVDSDDERVALAACREVLRFLPGVVATADGGPGDGELSEQLRRLADRLSGSDP